MFRAMRAVFAKEMRDLVRDRRTLLFLFATPVLIPLLGLVSGAFLVWQIVRQADEGMPVVVVNGEQLPGLVAELEDESLLQLVDTPPNLEQALQSGELTALLEVPPDAVELLEAEKPLTLTLTSSRSGWLPDFAVVSIQDAVGEYTDGIVRERLARRELDPGWLDPIRLERETAAPTGVAAAPIVAGGALPSLMGSIFLTLAVTSWTFSGGLSIVSHMTVGEKERCTMESLLVTPASRIGIVLGKIALSLIVSVVTIGLWSLDSLAYVFLLSIFPAGPVASVMPVAAQVGYLSLAVVWLVLLMLPLMTMTNGLVAGICTFAKNYRESNLFLGGLQLLLPGLAFLSTFGFGAAPPAVVYALPVVGVMVAIRDLFGGGVAPGILVLTWVAAAAYAVGSILLATYIFSREWALMRGV